MTVEECETLFVRLFGRSNPVVKVIDFLLDNEAFEYSKTDVARGAGISGTTLAKVWSVLEEFGIVEETGRIGRARMYRLNRRNPIVGKLIELDDAISEYYFKKNEG